jgi:tyrosinase
MIFIKQASSWSLIVALAAYLEPFVGAHYAITGVQTGVDKATGARPLRRNILDLQTDVPTWYASLVIRNSPFT